MAVAARLRRRASVAWASHEVAVCQIGRSSCDNAVQLLRPISTQAPGQHPHAVSGVLLCNPSNGPGLRGNGYGWLTATAGQTAVKVAYWHLQIFSSFLQACQVRRGSNPGMIAPSEASYNVLRSYALKWH